jgi:hypothetical protein
VDLARPAGLLPRRRHEAMRNPHTFIPAKAGIKLFEGYLDPDFRRGDDQDTFYRSVVISAKRMIKRPPPCYRRKGVGAN